GPGRQRIAVLRHQRVGAAERDRWRTGRRAGCRDDDAHERHPRDPVARRDVARAFQARDAAGLKAPPYVSADAALKGPRDGCESIRSDDLEELWVFVERLEGAVPQELFLVRGIQLHGAA